MTQLYAHITSGDIQSWEEWEADCEQGIIENFHFNPDGTYTHPEGDGTKTLQEWVQEDLEECLIAVDDEEEEI